MCSHPFKSGRWCFAHNDQIADFGELRRELEASLSDARYAERAGNLDSELLFLLLFEHGLEKAVHAACTSVIDLIKTATQGSKKATRISAVFSNGKQLYALGYSSDSRSPFLYFRHQLENGIIIASEPLDNEADAWSPVADSALTIADRSGQKYHALAV